jgi:hypothetical protein
MQRSVTCETFVFPVIFVIHRFVNYNVTSSQDGYGGDSDSGISDTDQSPASPSSASEHEEGDKENKDAEDALNLLDPLEAFDEELQSILTPPPEEEGDWDTITSSDFLAALEDSPTVAAAVDLFSDTESVLFEAGLEKNPGFFKKNQPSGFFCFFFVFFGFFGFFIYLPRRESF